MPLPPFVPPTIHHEAIDWATRVSSNGGTISTTVLRAVSAFCAAADLAGPGGFRSAMYRLNLFAGGNLSGCLVPLYRGPTFGGTNVGFATDTNNNFVSADFVETGATGGLKGNGVAKFLNTGLPTNSLPNGTSLHLSASGTGLATSGGGVFAGSFNNAGPALFVLDEFASGYSGGVRAFRAGTFAAGQFPQVTTPGAVESHVIGSKTSATSSVLYRGGSSAASSATNLTVTRTAFPIYVFALNNLNNAISSGCSAGRYRMYSIGTGLDASQAAAFSAAVIQFNAALER
jgi:hypothetical protein